MRVTADCEGRELVTGHWTTGHGHGGHTLLCLTATIRVYVCVVQVQTWRPCLTMIPGDGTYY